ncbi:MAG: cytochrome c [Myxococcota bacterium]
MSESSSAGPRVQGVVIAALLALCSFAMPAGANASAKPEAEADELLARGTYLAAKVARCSWCHSPVDRSLAFPVARRPTGSGGGFLLTPENKFPGTLAAPAITPRQVGDWSDADLQRAIVNGTRPDGTRLFRWIVHDTFESLTNQDMKAIIAWIRSLKEAESQAPARDLKLAGRLILPFMRTDDELSEAPPSRSDIEEGEYLATLSGCINCHTPRNTFGQRKRGQSYSGGDVFHMPDGAVLVSPNITPDTKTGIGSWSKPLFIQMFKRFEDATAQNPEVKTSRYWRTEMPWTALGGMSERDLGLIYDYLMSLEAQENEVVRFTPGTTE